MTINARKLLMACVIAVAMCQLNRGGVANAAVLVSGDPLIPAGLQVGDAFHLVFVSSNKIQRDLLDGSDDGSDDSTITQWDNWVGSVANASTLAGIPSLNWSAMVSLTGSPGIAAKDHALVSAPVYLTNGSLVATGFSDLWDGSIANPILYDENGALINQSGGSGAGRLVWTGSSSSGGIDTLYPLSNGIEAGRTGNSPATSGSWIQQGAHERRGPDTALRVYALSEAITVIAPEPNSIVLTAAGMLGLMGVLWRRRRC